MEERAGAWVVVLAFNEGRVVSEVARGLLALGYPVVVVDDGSSDGTVEALAGLPVHLCRHLVNLGQGAALATGLRHALAERARYLVTFDADGQHDPTDIPALLAPLEGGGYDVALGTRFAPGASTPGLPRARAAVLRLGALTARLTLRLPLTDTHNGLRAFTRDAAARLRITQNRMAHASQILHEIRRLSLRVIEVPVHVRYTAYSLGKGQRASAALDILWDSILERFSR